MKKTLLTSVAMLFWVAGMPVVTKEGTGLRLSVPTAQADDDDGGDDDDDGPRVRARPRAVQDDDDDAPAPRRAAPAPPPEFIVSVPDDASLGAIEALGYTIVARDRIDLIGANIARLQPPSGVTLEAARTQILAAVAASVVDLNTLYRPEDLPCGPEDCAAFEMIGWSGGGSCSLAPTIGMIDTGVNPEHPSLSAGRIEVISVVAEGRRAASKVHGTAVALLIAGDAASRTPGTLPSARLIAAEAFHRTGAGDETADVFDVVRGIETLADRNVDVVNMSFSGGQNLLLQQAIEALAARNVPVVAAAGNSGPRSEPLFPAAYPQAVAVTAVDAENNVYRQANAGEHIAFAAPGVRLWTAASVSGGRYRSGTSYATPFVTSALAVQRALNPDQPIADLVRALADGATDLGAAGRDATFGHGLVKMPDCGTGTAAEDTTLRPVSAASGTPGAPAAPAPAAASASAASGPASATPLAPASTAVDTGADATDGASANR